MAFITKDFKTEYTKKLFNMRFPPNIKILSITSNCYKYYGNMEYQYKLGELKDNFEQNLRTLNSLEELSLNLFGY